MYLIFSVNKSGEFFGYARMESEIEDSATTGRKKREDVNSELAVPEPSVMLAGPKTKVTPRTKNCPRGKIFEDEVRGTVFWEVAESSDDDDGDFDAYQLKVAEKWGNPFQIEWIKSFSPFLSWHLTTGPYRFNFNVPACSETLGMAIEKSKSLVMELNLNLQLGRDF